MSDRHDAGDEHAPGMLRSTCTAGAPGTCRFSDTDFLLRMRISGFLALPRAVPLGK